MELQLLFQSLHQCCLECDTTGKTEKTKFLPYSTPFSVVVRKHIHIHTAIFQLGQVHSAFGCILQKEQLLLHACLVFSLSNFPKVITSTANYCSILKRTTLPRHNFLFRGVCALKEQLKSSAKAWSCKHISMFSLYLPYPL